MLDILRKTKDFKIACEKNAAAISSANARIAQNNAKLSDMAVEEAGEEVELIKIANIELAQDKWLLDNYYGQYLETRIKRNTGRPNSYYEGTMSQEEWLKALSTEERIALLKGGDTKVRPKNSGHYDRPYSTKRNFRYDYKHDRRYKNLGWKKFKMHSNDVTKGWFGEAGSFSVGIGPVSTSA